MVNMHEEILNIKNQAIAQISSVTDPDELEQIRINLFGKNGKFTELAKSIRTVSDQEKKETGLLINEVKNTLFDLIAKQKNNFKENAREWFDPTIPGVKPKLGHLHLVTQAIDE